jgi:hypothetical protein
LGRTVAELQATMCSAEFISWAEFYRQCPFDDFHRFHRPAALVAGSLGGGGEDDMRKRLDWLQPRDDGMTSGDRDLFRAMRVTR